jgi:hypothetical protein
LVTFYEEDISSRLQRLSFLAADGEILDFDIVSSNSCISSAITTMNYICKNVRALFRLSDHFYYFLSISTFLPYFLSFLLSSSLEDFFK